jgi:hypothetical protein
MAEEYKIKLTTDASEVNKEIKETSKDIKDASDEQGIFAKQTALLSGAFKKLKGGVRSVITTFKTLKGAIAATGIGLLVIAFGSLVAFFTKTQKGVDLLDQAMAGLGAAVDVVVDRISKFGSSIMKFFSGDFSGAIEGITETFSGLTDELIKETKAAASLEETMQGLLDLERDFAVQKAKNNVIIREANAAALDQNIALETRVNKLKEAMALIEEQALEEERLATIKFETISAQVALGESLREDLDKQAAAEIELINIRAEAAGRRKALVGQLQSLNKQLETQESEQALNRLNEEERLSENVLLSTTSINQKKIDDAKNTNSILIDTRKDLNRNLLYQEKQLTSEEMALRKANTMSQLNAGAQLAGALSSLAGDNKELAIAQAVISTLVGVNKAFEQAGPIGFITGAAVLATGLQNVRTIMNTKVKSSGGGGGGGGGSIPSVPPLAQSLGQAVPQNGNINDLVNQGNSNEPIQAYVISQDVTDSQEAQSYIKNQTTL